MPMASASEARSPRIQQPWARRKNTPWREADGAKRWSCAPHCTLLRSNTHYGQWLRRFASKLEAVGRANAQDVARPRAVIHRLQCASAAIAAPFGGLRRIRSVAKLTMMQTPRIQKLSA